MCYYNLCIGLRTTKYSLISTLLFVWGGAALLPPNGTGHGCMSGSLQNLFD